MILWIQFPEHITKSYSTCFVLIWIHFKPISNISSSVNMIFPSKDPCLKLKSQVPKKPPPCLKPELCFTACCSPSSSYAGVWESEMVSLTHLWSTSQARKATSDNNSWTQVFTLKPQNDAPLQVLRKPECWGRRQLLETAILNKNQVTKLHKNNNRLHYQRPASTLPPTKTSKHLQFTRRSGFNDCVMHILRKPLSCSDNSKSGIDNIHSLRGAQASVSVYDALSEKSGLLTSGKCPLLNTQLSQMIWLRSRILLQHWTHCKLKHHRLIWTLYVLLVKT